jgi:hydrogenase-4 component B
MSTEVLLIAVAVIALSGTPGLLLSRRSALGQWIAASLNVLGSGLGAAALVLQYLCPDLSDHISIDWAFPLGRFAAGVDDLGVAFLAPIFLISGLGSVYGLSYWKQRRHAGDGRKLRLCWGLMTAGMAMVIVARDGVLFLIAWEIMALAAFFLVSTEERKREVREAGWVYLVATHVGTLCLFGFFALLHLATGSFHLWPSVGSTLSPRLATALFALGALGFGLKAGLMPLHVWLPGAHANAPSHVSAILSGVLLKTGVYGLVRLAGLMPNPPLWWGGTLLVAGTLSAVLGIAFAAGQRDLKRLLAYSSIENVGIIVLGVGLATLGRSLDRPDWVVLGLGGALLHLLNHSLFKPLLFMGAGGVLRATHTREMDRLGGLAKSMPKTFVLFLIGAVAISGLPPLNGFVSELFLYIGLFRTVADFGELSRVATSAQWGWVTLAAPALALVGAITVGSFVKLLGTVFAGTPRSAQATLAHEPDRVMLVPMWVLAGCCVLIGILPVLTVGVLDRAIAGWAPSVRGTGGSIASYVPIGWLTAIALALLTAVALGGLWILWRRPSTAARAAGTWDCGYARPTARMQYSGSSFSQMLVDLLSWALWPRHRPPRINGVFAAPSNFASDVPDVVLDRSLLPAFGSAEWLLGWARVIQRGPIQMYLLYVLATLLLLLLFA